MKEIKACIFDLDGVVVDTAKYHFLAWRRLADGLGFEFTERDNEALKGVSRMASLDILLGVGQMADKFSDVEKQTMAWQKNEWYLEYVNRMKSDEILPGVELFLRSVRSAGIKVGLGSASKNARLILSKVEIEEMFDAIVDGNMVSRAKPDPEVFVMCADLLGARASESVVFEDAEAGIEAASRAGMKSVGVGGSPLLAASDIEIDGFDGFTLEKLIDKLSKK